MPLWISALRGPPVSPISIRFYTINNVMEVEGHTHLYIVYFTCLCEMNARKAPREIMLECPH
jgi:hypothetical protein